MSGPPAAERLVTGTTSSALVARREGDHGCPVVDIDRSCLDRDRVLARPSAGRKGHSFFGYFVFSLFFFPAAIIVAYLVEDRTQSAVNQPPGVVRLP